MKRFNWLLVGLVVLLLAMVPLTGCVSKSEYEALETEHATLVKEKSNLETELDGVQSDLTKLQAEHATLVKEKSSLETELDGVESDLTKLQAKHATLVKEKSSLETELKGVQSDLTKSQAEHATLVKEKSNLETELKGVQSDLTSAQAKYDAVKADYEAAKKELAEIKKVYPPRDFSSLKELKDWLLANDVSERPAATSAEILYSRALEIQEDALKDGYIISAWIDYYSETELFYVNCTAVADGDVWMWNPEGDEPVNFSDGTDLLKVR